MVNQVQVQVFKGPLKFQTEEEICDAQKIGSITAEEANALSKELASQKENDPSKPVFTTEKVEQPKAEDNAKVNPKQQKEAEAVKLLKRNAMDSANPTKKSNSNYKPAKGWYSVRKAQTSSKEKFPGLTVENILAQEEKGTAAAKYVLDELLKTKVGDALSSENKAKLLALIIKKNPSVFDKHNGTLKEGFDLEKLDIPPRSWIIKEFGIKVSPKDPRRLIRQKDPHPCIIANNGYYAKKQDDNSYKYFSPDGVEITAGSFKNNCPTLYKQIQAQAK